MDAQLENRKVAYRSQSEGFIGSGPDSIKVKKPPLKGRERVEAERRAQELKARNKMSKTGQPF